jgi:hypothetical protein
VPFISAAIASLQLVGCPNWLWLGGAVPYRRFEDLDIAPETLYYEVAGVPSPAMLHEAPLDYGRKAK